MNPRAALLLLSGLLCAAGAALARQGEPPYSLGAGAKAAAVLPMRELAPVDAAARRAEADADAARSAGKRLAVADGYAVSISPAGDGRWDTLGDGSRLWRLRVRAAGATDLRFDFGRYALPPGATLYLIGADRYYQGPYGAADAGDDGTFHSPPVPGDEATLELRLPAGADLPAGAFELTRVGAGFRDVFAREPSAKAATGPGASGACNVNVACPLGEPYPEPIRAVAHYEFVADDDHQTYICTGTLLNDVPRDRRNYFLTAAHCIGSASEASSMVLYWNYQSTQCASLVAPPGGFLDDDQHGGARLRATRADVDFTLLELTQAPDPAWNVYYAGWDASGAVPAGTIGIHHPSGDAKKITAGPRPTTTYSCIADVPTASNTHWRTGPYSQGTTEGGSSGSALFAPAGGGNAGFVIGTLSGGSAACSGTRPNAGTDCYGKLSIAWNGSGSGARLRDWLDPAGTGTTVLGGAEAAGDAASLPPPTAHLRHARPARRAPLRSGARPNVAQ